MRVLVACEFSGQVRDAFRAKGHDALSCDLLPTEAPGPHYRGDIRDLLGGNWDLMIAFPPCTRLSTVGAAFWPRWQEDGSQPEALAFVWDLMDAPIPRIAVENPVGKINTAIRKPDQIIHPWMFGDPWNKRTCLWLKGLPLLKPDKIVEPCGPWVHGGTHQAHLAIPDHERGLSDAQRAHHRSKTFPGIARAMAEQWTDDSHAATERKVA